MTLPPASHALLAMLCLAASGLSHAQQIHRIVGPDGKVTFSDRAPTSETGSTVLSPSGAVVPVNTALPLELRQISSRFPVTLYTGDNCAPCVSARNLLVLRGVPFTERTVSTNDDVAALRSLSDSTSLPFATIGGQQLHGFSDSEWTQYLDAAGYPKQSRLPPGYKRPAATPLVAAKPAVPASAPADDANAVPPAPARTVPAPPSGGPTPTNPAGIRF